MNQSVVDKNSEFIYEEEYSANPVEGDKSKLIFERNEELQALRFYMSAAAEGQGSFILVNGEAGIGKSFLIRIASRVAVESGFLFSEIDFKEYSQYEPFMPFIILVQNLEGVNSETNKLLEQLKTSAAPKADEDAKDIKYNAESFEKLNNDRTILQQLIVGKLLDASRKKPIFLFLNNLHIVSQSTFQFIHYLTGKFTNHGIMICAALRQDGEETNKEKIPAYADIIKRMNREGLITKLHLKKIKKDSFKKYLNQRFQRSDFNNRFLNLVYELSKGLPGLFLQYLDVLEKQGFIYKRDNIWYNADNLNKQKIHELVIDHSTIKQIHHELNDYPDDKIELLKYAALFDEAFNHHLMSVVTKKSKIKILRDLEYLRNEKYISGLEADLFELKNETIRVAVIQLMDEKEIIRKHGLIAEAVLEDRDIPETLKVFLLANHYKAAHNESDAFKYLNIAGNIALRNLAFAEARNLFASALTILDLKPVLTKTKSLIELLLKCAWVNRILGFFEESLSFCNRAGEILNESNVDVYTNLLLQKGLTLFRLQDWQKSVECFEKCLEFESDISFFDSALANYGLASVHFELGNYKQSKKFYERALDDIKRIEHKSFEADILNNLGAVESVTGNSMQAVARFSDSIPIYEELDDSYGLAQVYNNLGLTYADGKKWHDADLCYRKCLTICDKIGIIPLKSIVFLNRAYALIQLDELAKGEEYNTKALRLVKQMNDQLGIAEYHKNLGVINRKSSNWGEARNNFEKAQKLYQSLDNRLGLADTAYEHGLLSYDMDDEAEFEKWFEKSIQGYMEIGLEQRVHSLEDERFKLLTKNQMNQ